MDNMSKLDKFLSKEVVYESNAFWESMLDYVNNNKDIAIDSIVHSFQEVYDTNKRQENKKRQPQYVQYTLMRSRALQQKAFYYIELFDENYYFGGELNFKEIPFYWLYEAYFSFCNKVKEKSQYYVMQIGEIELERICMIELNTCHKLMKYLFEAALFELMETKQYQEMPVETHFLLGDYRGEAETLFIKNDMTNQIWGLLNGILQSNAE